MASKANEEFVEFFKNTVLAKLVPLAEVIIRDGQNHHPMIAEFDRMGQMTIGEIVGMDDEIAKQAVAILLRRLAEKPRNYAVVFIVEGWVISRKTVQEALAQRPSEADDRGEALIISAYHRDQQMTAQYPIVRPNGLEGDKKGSTLGEPFVGDGMMDQGTFGNAEQPTTLH